MRRDCKPATFTSSDPVGTELLWCSGSASKLTAVQLERAGVRLQRVHVAVLALIAFESACSDRSPNGPGNPATASGRLVTCQADVRAQTLRCDMPSASVTGSGTSGIAADVILGGQGRYVQLRSSNVSYDASTEVFQADVTVQNLTPLMLGTPDGSTVTGVKVFFHSGPSVVSGTGAVSVANADGVGTFTGTNQPFFLYNEILPKGQVSAAKTWQWAVSSTVATFAFQVLVDAAAPVEKFYTLHVSVSGSGGRVSSTPEGISCTAGDVGSCTADFLSGTSVTLNAVADDDWEFGSWGGDCPGSAQEVTVVMTSNRSCDVAFNPLLRVTATGGGTVTSSPAGISCSPSCTKDFPLGTVVTLSATPASGRVFSGWSGDCAGTGDCVVTMSAAHSVGATFFDPRPASLSIGPKPLLIEVGAHPNLDVVVTDANGNPIPDATVTFVSRNPSVASLSHGDILNGLAPGQSVVVATASGGTSPSDSLLAIVAYAGGPLLMTDVTEFSFATGAVVTVTVIMDMRDSGELLGSTKVTVTWNPALLTYQSDANGGSGVSPTVNRSNVANGSLVLAMADPNGFAGRVELLQITFKAGSVAGVAGSLALTTSEVTGAGTFTDLLPKVVAATYPLITR